MIFVCVSFWVVEVVWEVFGGGDEEVFGGEVRYWGECGRVCGGI